MKMGPNSFRRQLMNARNSILGIACCAAVAVAWYALMAPRLPGGAVGHAPQGGSTPIQQGTVIGQVRFTNGDTATGGHGQPVAGIQAAVSEQIAYHIHAHLSLFDNGRQIAVPRGIGIVPPRVVQDGFVVGGRAFYWLHTHDATGIIHIESPIRRLYSLGQFFAVWGEPLTGRDVAGMRGSVHAFLDGRPYHGNLRTIPLTAHAEITLEVGTPIVPPPRYIFPPGL